MSFHVAGHLTSAMSTDALPRFGSAAYADWVERSALLQEARTQNRAAKQSARLLARTRRWQRRAAHATEQVGRLQAQAH